MGSRRADHDVVLLAEDDAATARVMVHWITRSGADVVWASSSADALELARRRGPDVAVVDPSLDGSAGLLDSLRRHSSLRCMPVLTVSPDAVRDFSAERFGDRLEAALRAA